MSVLQRYTEYRYLFPPRADKKGVTPKSLLGTYERQGWWAQIKKNGTSNVIHVAPDRRLICKTRHPTEANGDHRMWKPTDASSRLFKRLPGSGWYVIVAELMHNKTKFIKDINYIHDILVADGNYLLGWTYDQRYRLLSELFLSMVRKRPDEMNSHIVLDDHTWLAKNHTRGFAKLFVDLEAAWAMGEKDEDEGLVLKNPKGVLEMCGKEGKNGSWQRKCRRPEASRSYSF